MPAPPRRFALGRSLACLSGTALWRCRTRPRPRRLGPAPPAKTATSPPSRPIIVSGDIDLVVRQATVEACRCRPTTTCCRCSRRRSNGSGSAALVSRAAQARPCEPVGRTWSTVDVRRLRSALGARVGRRQRRSAEDAALALRSRARATSAEADSAPSLTLTWRASATCKPQAGRTRCEFLAAAATWHARAGGRRGEVSIAGSGDAEVQCRQVARCRSPARATSTTAATRRWQQLDRRQRPSCQRR